MLSLRIQELRAAQGWSQAHLASLLKMNVKTIKNWELGVSEPSAKSIISLAKVFSVSADYLLEIDSRAVIRIDKLTRNDQICLIGICQLFINNAVDKYNDSR